MQFLLMLKTEANSAAPTPELMAAIGKLVEDMTRAGGMQGPGFEMETEVREMYPVGAFKGAANGKTAAAAR